MLDGDFLMNKSSTDFCEVDEELVVVAAVGCCCCFWLAEQIHSLLLLIGWLIAKWQEVGEWAPDDTFESEDDVTEEDSIGFEFDLGIKLERTAPQQLLLLLLLLQLDEDDPDEDKDDDELDDDDVAHSTVLDWFGITSRTFEFLTSLLELFISWLALLLFLLLLLLVALMRGESYMNASVFLRSSNAI